MPVLQGVQQAARQPAGSDDSRRTKAGPTILSAPRPTNERESTHGPQRKGANRACGVEFRQAAQSTIRWASFQFAMCFEAASPCRTGSTGCGIHVDSRSQPVNSEDDGAGPTSIAVNRSSVFCCRTAAVTESVPENFDFTTRVIDGSG